MLQIVIVFLSLLMAGCVTTGSTHAGSQLGGSSEAATPPQAHEAGDGLIFNILAAEFSAQRGDHQATYDYYQRALKQSELPEIAERGAKLSIHSQNVGQTIEATRHWVAREPESVEGRRILGALLLRDRQIELAAAQFEALIELHPDNQQAAFQLIAEQLRKEPNFVEAERLFDLLLERHAKSAAAWYARGWFDAKRKKSEQALKAVEQALKLQPGWGKAVVLRVSVLEELGRQEELLNFLQEQVEQFPEDVEILSRYGQALLAQGRDYEAVIQFESALELRPRSADILSALGLVHLSNKRYEAARPLLNTLLELGGHEDKANYYLGELEEGAGNRQTAIAHYASVGHGLIYFNARVKMAELVAKADVDAGLSVLRGLSLRDGRRQLQVLLLEGEVLEGAGRYMEAIEIYGEALELSPDNEDILYARAMAGDLAGKLDILERDLHAIIEKNPKHYHALNALGYTLTLRTTRYLEAKGYIERAIALRPNDFYVLDSMGWVLFKLGEVSEALNYLDRALVAKKDPEVAAHLGEVRWVSGDQEGAREIWQQAKQWDDSNPVLIEVLERFSQ